MFLKAHKHWQSSSHLISSLDCSRAHGPFSLFKLPQLLDRWVGARGTNAHQSSLGLLASVSLGTSIPITMCRCILRLRWYWRLSMSVMSFTSFCWGLVNKAEGKIGRKGVDVHKRKYVTANIKVATAQVGKGKLGACPVHFSPFPFAPLHPALVARSMGYLTLENQVQPVLKNVSHP